MITSSGKHYQSIFVTVNSCLLTLPLIPMGLPVFKTDGLINYFNTLDRKYGIDVGRRFEDGSIHSYLRIMLICWAGRR